MVLASKPKFFAGISIALILIISYFIKLNVEEGTNYQTSDTLLGILIFHNPFILLIYLSIATALIISGIKKIKFI
ncbi:MAG: hypothetical protein AABY16_01820 [Nanoarchaeota archaeon]